MEYKIVIPSHNRTQTLKNKSLAFLKKHNIPLSKIYIFVAPKQFLLYQEAFPEYQIIEGRLGLINQRNYIAEYFEERQPLLCMDDDISNILLLNQENNYVEINLNALIQEGFQKCSENSTRLWGVYAIKNKLFQRKEYSTGFYYCIGAFYGVLNDRCINVSFDYAEDIERCLLSTVKYGCIVRLNRYCIITKYYTEGGGLQDTRTLENNKECKMYFAEHFPEYFKAFERKGRTELRFSYKNDTSRVI